MTDVEYTHDYAIRDWETFSERCMEECIRAGNKIHFDLTYMTDVNNILNGAGIYADKYTSREIRYIRKHWTRFSRFVKFYKHDKELSNLKSRGNEW